MMVRLSEDEVLKTNQLDKVLFGSVLYIFSVFKKYRKLVPAYIERNATSGDYQSCNVIFDLVSSSVLNEHASYLEVS